MTKTINAAVAGVGERRNDRFVMELTRPEKPRLLGSLPDRCLFPLT